VNFTADELQQQLDVAAAKKPADTPAQQVTVTPAAPPSRSATKSPTDTRLSKTQLQEVSTARLPGTVEDSSLEGLGTAWIGEIYPETASCSGPHDVCCCATVAAAGCQLAVPLPAWQAECRYRT
jgi:hypothetical protein